MDYFDERSFGQRHAKGFAILVIILIGIAWAAIYIVTHDDGIIRGRVLNEEGEPVAGARVSLREKTINLLKPPVRTVTDDSGEFIYEEMEIIEFYISARKEGVGKAPRQWHHLYFKRQNYEIEEPIVLRPEEDDDE